MISRAMLLALPVLTMLLALPAAAQISVLDTAQDGGVEAEVAPAPLPCGTRPISIARMQWPSAALLAEIHARLLPDHFGCEVRIVAGDMAGTGSSMATTGQPAVAPELWITRIAEVWNQAIKAQAVRPSGNAYATQTFETWYVPDYMAETLASLTPAALGAGPAPEGEEADEAEAPTVRLPTRMRFISCPLDWSCAVINKNLLRAHGLEERFELVEPANRFEMDGLIAEAVSRREAFVTYYWAPNAVLEQFGFVALDLGEYDVDALRCLARAACANPQPSAFPAESVVIALAEWVYDEAPEIVAYFHRASFPLPEMNALMLALGQPGATIETVVEDFLAEREDVWRVWVGANAD